ncbi:MAG TPA: MG2 domain-containing protein, partial [Planctomycetaceae bacterium]|nr:MG2 domain-containing protein [Planctomycetaceae bacterium]
MHEHTLELVDALVHDALEPEQAAAVAEHCTSCPICQVALDEAHKRFAALSSLPMSEAGDDLLARTEAQIDAMVARSAAARERQELAAKAEDQRRRRVYAHLGVVAGVFGVAAIFIGMVQAYYANLSVDPYELQVLGERKLLPGELSSLRVLLFDREHNEPLADVPVTIELASKERRPIIQLASFRTDARGTGSPEFRIPEGIQGDYELRVSARRRGGIEQIVRDVQIARSWRVMVTTDKPVYQPGQTIHMRSLALQQPSRRPVAGQKADFRLTDPKGNVVFQQQIVTSKFGIVSADCPLAEEIIEGTYLIECRVGDTSSSAAVEVKKYVLPKFRIATNLDRTYYAPGDVLRGTLECAYFFGQPLAHGDAIVEIHTTDVAPRLLTTLECRLDAKGRGEFEYRLPDHLVGREQDQGDARARLTLTVADSAGQSQSQDVSCLVTNRPLRIEIIPESGKLVRGVQNRIYLLATYADGRPAADVRIAVSGISEELTTDQLGACVLELKPHSSSLELAFSVRDDEGHSVSQTTKLECDVASDAFALRIENPVIDGGQTLHLTAVGHGSQPVFVDFIKDRQLLLTASIEMEKGLGVLSVDLPAELSGTVQVCAYRFAEQGPAVRRTQVIHVTPASDLKIETIADRPEYRPGDTARLTFRIRDSRGRPMPGALSLSAVDEAVYSVLSQRPGMEQSFFTVDE